MTTQKNEREDLVRIFKDPENPEKVLVEVLGEPIVALKQMKAEPWLLKEKKDNEEK